MRRTTTQATMRTIRRMERGRVSLVSAATVAFLLACGPSDTPEAPAAKAPPSAAKPAAAKASDPAADRAAAEEIFASRCATCHGPTGQGDGPGSAALDPKPRNFQDPEWQASVSDEHIANIIQYGGAAVGRSPTMPGNPDLTSRPGVVEALVRHVRSLASKG